MNATHEARLKGFMPVSLAACWETLPILSTGTCIGGSDPLTAAAWRSCIAAIIFCLCFLCDGRLKPFRRKHLLFFLAMGIVMVLIGISLPQRMARKAL